MGLMCSELGSEFHNLLVLGSKMHKSVLLVVWRGCNVCQFLCPDYANLVLTVQVHYVREDFGHVTSIIFCFTLQSELNCVFARNLLVALKVFPLERAAVFMES